MEQTILKNRKGNWLKFGIDGLLVAGAFLLMYLLKRGELHIDSLYCRPCC